jgi:hypothetical protein
MTIHNARSCRTQYTLYIGGTMRIHRNSSLCSSLHAVIKSLDTAKTKTSGTMIDGDPLHRPQSLHLAKRQCMVVWRCLFEDNWAIHYLEKGLGQCEFLQDEGEHMVSADRCADMTMINHLLTCHYFWVWYYRKGRKMSTAVYNLKDTAKKQVRVKGRQVWLESSKWQWRNSPLTPIELTRSKQRNNSR